MTAWEQERLIEARARTQHSAFSHRQARAAGFSNPMIERRVRNGRWLRLDHRVYAHASSTPTWERQLSAATLSVTRSALSHTTAASVHGFTGFRRGGIHVVTSLSGDHRSRLATVHRSRHVETTRLNALPVVTPAHCFVQLAGSVAHHRVRAALHDAVAQDSRLLGAVQDRFVDLCRTRIPGLRVLKELLDELDDLGRPTESELERLALDAFALVPGLPALVVQGCPPWLPEAAERIDFVVPEWCLIIEPDGRAWHTRVGDFDRDRDRDAEAAVHGYHVMRPTWRKLQHDRAGFVDQLTRYGAARRPAA
jgi:hypothetical protein